MGARLLSGRLCIVAAVVVWALVAAPGVAGAAGVVAADAGDHFSLAVLSDGSLWGWGYNAHGQLGDGTTETHLAPSRVDTGTAWARVSAGYRHALALKSDGSLWSWGWNKDGQLGNGHAENTYVPDHLHTTPAQILTPTATWLEVAAGEDHSVALDAQSRIWAWGANASGQLGTGSTQPTATPVLVSASPGAGRFWRAVRAGDGVTVALASDGSVWQWGAGLTAPVLFGMQWPPGMTPPASDASWWTLSTARGHGSGVLSDSGLVSWTWDGSTPPVHFGYEYRDVAETTDVERVPPFEAALLIKLDRSLWVALNATGYPTPLIRGDGVTASLEHPIGNALNWSRVDAGKNHFLITKTDGSLWGWGRNSFGQLGDGTEADRVAKTLLPVRVILPTPIPNVVGMTQSDAVDRIAEMGFKTGTVTQVATTGVEVTRIISQTPAYDTLVMPGGNVNIAVSAGPPVSVPNVVGLAEEDAKAAIGAAGLGVSTVSQAYSIVVPKGAVVTQNPAAGSQVIAASKVALTVSKGPQPVVVPYTSGRTLSIAQSSLRSANLVVGAVRKEHSSTHAAGLVTRSDPKAGTQVLAGDTVDLYVSLGKPKPYVGTPNAPRSAGVSRSFTVSGSLKPRHTRGSYPVRIYRWKKTSSGSRKSYGYVRAKATDYSTYTKYVASMKLTSRGSWRVRAYAPADSLHAAAWSSGYDYLSVR